MLQDLPNIRERFYIKFDYGSSVVEIGVNKYTNGNTQGFQKIGKKGGKIKEQSVAPPS